MDDPERLKLIRARIQAGHLPRKPATKIYAGKGGDDLCDACGLTVDTTSIEYEFEDEGRTIRMHLRCFAAWAEQVSKRA